MSGLTNLQQYSYNVIMAGYNVFLSGNAGTGKSYLIELVVNDLTEQGLNVIVTASTGIAAYNINGVTAHRAFDIPVKPLTFKDNEYSVEESILEADVIILEEVSMVRMDVFDFISNKIFLANERRRRRNKQVIQFIVVGDFLQLPPVITKYDRDILEKHYGMEIGNGYAFKSKHWDKHKFINIILTEIVRQKNIEFAENLNNIRIGKSAYLDYFYNNSSKFKQINAIELCGTNREVNEKNKINLDKLETPEISYESIVTTNLMNSEYPCERILTLKEKARVMLLVNDKSLIYTNGSLGNVIKLSDDLIIVKLDNGTIVNIERYEWKIYNYKTVKVENTLDEYKLERYEVGTVKQFPLRLAYAVTMHKSQGQTYDRVNLSPYSWDCGQLYVALSRIRDINNLYFNYKPDKKDVAVSLDVIAFYNSIVKTSNPELNLKNKRVITKQKDILDNDMESILMKLGNL